ncbi:MAG TPA: glycosyltransferase [Gemmatimonadaceae bacterium]|nr:glycosyltransferase [Gemmatimonadaceae bacterium]
MRVLFLAHSFPRTAGDAAGSFLLRLAQALEAEGITVQVVAPAAPGLADAEQFDGVGVDRFRYAPRRFERLAYTGTMAQDVRDSWSARLTMLSFLGSEFVSAVRSGRRFQPDLVHAHWWFPGGLVGTWVASMAGVPLITTLHGSDVRLARTVVGARPVFRHVLRHSAAVTAVSNWLAGEAGAVLPNLKPVVAPMPVDTTLFAPGSERSTDRLLFVGRLNAQKGVSTLIDALPAIQQPYTVDIIGDGPDRTSLEAHARELHVADRIRWHGALPHDALPPFYQRAAALVVPSIDEGLGLVAVEGQICATPVIAANSGGLGDIVRNGQTGVLVPPLDAPALASAIDDILANPDRAHELGAAGRVHALASFAPESAARRYAMLYRSTLEHAKKS